MSSKMPQPIKERTLSEHQKKEFKAFYELAKKTIGEKYLSLPKEERWKEIENNPTLKKAHLEMFRRLYPKLTGNRWANVKIKDVPPEGAKELVDAYREDDPIGYEEDLKEFNALPKLEKEAIKDGNAWTLMKDINEFKRTTRASNLASREFMDSLSPKEWEAFKMGAKWALKHLVKSIKYKKHHFQEVDSLRKKLKVKDAIEKTAIKHGFSIEGFKQQYYDRWLPSKK